MAESPPEILRAINAGVFPPFGDDLPPLELPPLAQDDNHWITVRGGIDMFGEEIPRASRHDILESLHA